MKQGDFYNHYDIAKLAKIGFVHLFCGSFTMLIIKDVTQSHTVKANTGLAVPLVSSREKVRAQIGFIPERG